MSIRAFCIPSWLSDMPGHMALGTKEIAEIFLIHRSSVIRAVESGLVPPPRFSAPRGGSKKPKEYWTLADVRAWARAGK